MKALVLRMKRLKKRNDVHTSYYHTGENLQYWNWNAGYRLIFIMTTNHENCNVEQIEI